VEKPVPHIGAVVPDALCRFCPLAIEYDACRRIFSLSGMVWPVEKLDFRNWAARLQEARGGSLNAFICHYLRSRDGESGHGAFPGPW
jgi:hypothetical protein